MPRATSKYPFEWKILQAASHLSSGLAGHEYLPFLILLSPEGQTRQILFGDSPERKDVAVWDPLMQAARAWFMYDPFDGPVYTYIAWQQVSQRTLERILRITFEETDFTASDGRLSFPLSWNVMF